MSTRQFDKTGLTFVAAVMVATSLSACTGYALRSPFEKTTAMPEHVAETVAPAPEPTSIDVASLDPINAPPPAAGAPMADAMLVPAPGAQTGDTSQRVPLGTLAATPPAGAPMSLMQQPAAAAKPAQPATPMVAQAPEPAPPLIQPRPAAKVETPKEMPKQETMRLAAAPQLKVKPAAPVLRPPLGRPADTQLIERNPSVDTPPETVIISSTTAPPIEQGREFVPAAVVPGQILVPEIVRGDIPMTAAEKNIVQRFETLRRLLDESLITQDEYNRRRAANVGALLPYTREPGGVGLERSVPSSDAIIARLAALRRSFEMRAISATQHALERTMILNALLPEDPTDRADQKPPPADVLEAAAIVGHLEGLRTKSLISVSEFEGERDAIEHVLKTGLLPSQELASAKKAPAAKAGAAKADAAKAKPAGAEADPMTAEITGPVLHLASFRTEASARQAWQDALTRNKTALASLKPIIRKVDLGQERGIFYRLMAGTFNSMSDAEAVCIQLKQNNQFCRASADGS